MSLFISACMEDRTLQKTRLTIVGKSIEEISTNIQARFSYLWTSQHKDIIIADHKENLNTRNLIFLKRRHKARFKSEHI